MTCPRCGVIADPLTTSGLIEICSTCGQSVIADRPAAYSDIKDLAPQELDRLRAASATVPHVVGPADVAQRVVATQAVLAAQSATQPVPAPDPIPDTPIAPAPNEPVSDLSS